MIIDSQNATDVELHLIVEIDDWNDTWGEQKVDAIAMLHRFPVGLRVIVTTTDANLLLPPQVGGVDVVKEVRKPLEY